MKKPTENDLVKACLAYLKARNVMCWRNNTGAYAVGKRFIRYGEPGSPDIIGMLSNGRFLGVECKIGEAKQSAAQEAFEVDCLRHRGRYVLVHSVEELESLL